MSQNRSEPFLRSDGTIAVQTYSEHSQDVILGEGYSQRIPNGFLDISGVASATGSNITLSLDEQTALELASMLQRSMAQDRVGARRPYVPSSRASS